MRVELRQEDMYSRQIEVAEMNITVGDGLPIRPEPLSIDSSYDNEPLSLDGCFFDHVRISLVFWSCFIAIELFIITFVFKILQFKFGKVQHMAFCLFLWSILVDKEQEPLLDKEWLNHKIISQLPLIKMLMDRH